MEHRVFFISLILHFVHSYSTYIIQYALLQYNELKDSRSGLCNMVHVIVVPSRSFLLHFFLKNTDSE